MVAVMTTPGEKLLDAIGAAIMLATVAVFVAWAFIEWARML